MNYEFSEKWKFQKNAARNKKANTNKNQFLF